MSKKATAALLAAISLVGAGLSATYVVSQAPGYRDKISGGIQASSQSANQPDLSRDSDISAPTGKSAEQVDVSGQNVGVLGPRASRAAKLGPSSAKGGDARTRTAKAIRMWASWKCRAAAYNIGELRRATPNLRRFPEEECRSTTPGISPPA